MKLPFFLETQLNKILKPQIVTIVRTYIDGKLSKKFYGKSLLANFLQMLYAQYSNGSAGTFAVSGSPFVNNSQAVRTTGALASANATIMTLNASTGVVTNGIIVGSNNTAVTATDYVVNTLIAHGSGAGQLLYGAQGASQGVQISGLNSSFILQRTFTNSSGANVTVREICIYVLCNTVSFCQYRDIVSPDDVIGNGQVYTVNITFQITS